MTDRPAIPPNLAATAARNDLLDAVRWAMLAVDVRPTMFVLGGVVLDASDERGGIAVSGYNYETVARAEVAAPGARGKALLPGRLLLDMLRALPKGCDVSLATVGDVVTLTAADGVYRLPVLPLADYPTPPEPPRQEAALTGNHLVALARVGLAAGKDDTLPILTAICLRKSLDGTLEAAATDRYRLAVGDLKVRFDVPDTVLLPARVLSKALPFLKAEKRVVMGVNNGKQGTGLISFDTGRLRIVTRTLEGEFPKYQSLVPDTFTGSCTLPREAMLDALQRAAVVHRHGPARFEIDGSTLTIRVGAEDPSSPQAAFTVHGIETEGTIENVALSSTLLPPGLKAMTGGKVKIAANGPTRPHVFTCEEDEDFTYLLMPVRMSG